MRLSLRNWWKYGTEMIAIPPEDSTSMRFVQKWLRTFSAMFHYPQGDIAW